MFLVSDAMPTVGGPNKFSLYGSDVHLENGRLVNDEGSLAGAHTTQADGVYRLANFIGIDRSETLRAAISVPSRLIGCKARADIVGMSVQDLICLSEDLSFTGYLEL
jgi:N-acetylglucosamine-6-phosphate deacetylase